MPRFLAFFFLSTLVLAGCGGSDEAVSACVSQYEGSEITTCLPEGWIAISRTQLDERQIPPETIVAFQSETPYAGQFATVTVTREVLARTMTSEEYSEASIISVQTLPGYTEIDQRAVTIGEADLAIHVFSAQPREDQPESRFYQISLVSPNNIGYSFTGATPLSTPEELEDEVTVILQNAGFPENAAIPVNDSAASVDSDENEGETF